MAIGNPYGFGHSVTLGIISGLERYGLQLSAYESYIQTDAAIHLGNSGGALIDSEGRLVGINTLIYTAGNDSGSETPGIGINLATPSDLAASVLNDIVQYGSVIRGWLGGRSCGAAARPALDTLDCARIGLDSLCSNMATCFALLVPLARTVIPPRHFALKGSAAQVFFILWANWCAGSPPQVLSGGF